MLSEFRTYLDRFQKRVLSPDDLEEIYQWIHVRKNNIDLLELLDELFDSNINGESTENDKLLINYLRDRDAEIKIIYLFKETLSKSIILTERKILKKILIEFESSINEDKNEDVNVFTRENPLLEKSIVNRSKPVFRIIPLYKKSLLVAATIVGFVVIYYGVKYFIKSPEVQIVVHDQNGKSNEAPKPDSIVINKKEDSTSIEFKKSSINPVNFRIDATVYNLDGSNYGFGPLANKIIYVELNDLDSALTIYELKNSKYTFRNDTLKLYHLSNLLSKSKLQIITIVQNKEDWEDKDFRAGTFLIIESSIYKLHKSDTLTKLIKLTRVESEKIKPFIKK